MNRYWTRDVNFALFAVGSANIIIIILIFFDFFSFVYIFGTSESVSGCNINEKRKKMHT